MARTPLESVPLAEVDRLYQLNTLGALRVVRAVLPAMRERGSARLVFVSSIQGRLVLPVIGPYGASKWALEAEPFVLAKLDWSSLGAGPADVHRAHVVPQAAPGGVA